MYYIKVFANTINIASSIRYNSDYINKESICVDFYSNLSLFLIIKMYIIKIYIRLKILIHTYVLQSLSAVFQSSSPSQTCLVSTITRYVFEIFWGLLYRKTFKMFKGIGITRGWTSVFLLELPQSVAPTGMQMIPRFSLI